MLSQLTVSHHNMNNNNLTDIYRVLERPFGSNNSLPADTIIHGNMYQLFSIDNDGVLAVTELTCIMHISCK